MDSGSIVSNKLGAWPFSKMETTLYSQGEPRGLMLGGARCWVCSRKSDDLSYINGHREKLARIGDDLRRVSAERTMFLRSSEKWDRLPNEVAEADAEFVLEHSDRFAAYESLPEAVQAGVLLSRLARASERLSSGERFTLGSVAVPASWKVGRQLLKSRISSLEKGQGRRIAPSADEGGPEASGLEGLSMREGLRFLRTCGTLYFDAQADLLQEQLSIETEAPGAKVSKVRLEGLPDVALCGTCQELFEKQEARRVQHGERLSSLVLPTLSLARIRAGLAAKRGQFVTAGLALAFAFECGLAFFLLAV